MSTVTTQTPTADEPAPLVPRRRAWPRIALVLSLVILVISLVRVFTGATNLTQPGTIAAALGLAVPIGMAALGGLWAERAGVVNIGLEGMMILGTFGAGWAGYQYGPWAGVAMAIFMGTIGGLLHAVATVIFAVDHVVSGVAINILGLGAAKYLAAAAFTGVPGGGETQSPRIPEMGSVTIPGISDLAVRIWRADIPVVSDVAGIIGGLTTRMSYITILAMGMVVLSWWLLWRTPFGLRLRSCGEAPYAAETLGVKVMRYKFVAVLISGGLSGLGGAYLAIVAAQIYREGQTGGRGFIGLAAMLFGNWRPGGLAVGAGLFGYTDALQLRGGESVRALLILAAIALGLVAFFAWRAKRWLAAIILTAMVVGSASAYFLLEVVPPQMSFTAPYVITLLVLALATQRLRMPAADGQPYIKGQER
jgi:general nucleoside transport system permease protein